MPSSPSSAPTAVLFDLDGTLIDSIELIVSAARHAFASRPGPAPTEEEFRAGIGRPLMVQFGPYATDEADLQQLITAYRCWQLEHHDRLTTTYAGVMDAVGALRAEGHMLGIVTSKMDAIARRSLSHVGLLEQMDVVVGCDCTTQHKPHPEPVFYALNQLGVGADRAVFVGDSPYDMEAGTAAGVVTAAALWGPFARDTLVACNPSYLLERPEELPGVVRDSLRE